MGRLHKVERQVMRDCPPSPPGFYPPLPAYRRHTWSGATATARRWHRSHSQRRGSAPCRTEPSGRDRTHARTPDHEAARATRRGPHCPARRWPPQAQAQLKRCVYEQRDLRVSPGGLDKMVLAVAKPCMRNNWSYNVILRSGNIVTSNWTQYALILISCAVKGHETQQADRRTLQDQLEAGQPT